MAYMSYNFSEVKPLNSGEARASPASPVPTLGSDAPEYKEILCSMF